MHTGRFFRSLRLWLGTTVLAIAHLVPAAAETHTGTAIFAGGCFWCSQYLLDQHPAILKTEVGYTGGNVANPTYEQVSAHMTGHAEAVRVTYDTSKVSHAQLLDYFWHTIDPTVADRQFCNIGNQYRTGIHALDDEQYRTALASKEALERSGVLRHVQPPVKVDSSSYPGEFQLEAQLHAEANAAAEFAHAVPGKVLTEIVRAGPFYPAETYHQHYAKKNPIRFAIYRAQCGGEARLKHIWGTSSAKP